MIPLFFLILLPILDHSANPTDTVVSNSAFFNWIADTMYTLINLAPRIPQTATVQSTDVSISSFSSVAVGWLSINGTDTKDLITLIGQYAVSIIVVTAISGLVFLVLLVIGIWWCVKQCVGGKQNPHKEVSPCTIWRSKYRTRSRCGCRICYTIVALFMFFGVVIVAIGGILLNSGVKGVFDKTVPIFSNIMDIANDLLEPDPESFPGALDTGDAILKVTNAVPNYIEDQGNLTLLMEGIDKLQYWVNVYNSLLALQDKNTEQDIDTYEHLKTATIPDIIQTHALKWGTIKTNIESEFTTEGKCNSNSGTISSCKESYAHMAALVNHYIQPYLNTLTLAYVYVTSAYKDATTDNFDNLASQITRAMAVFNDNVMAIASEKASIETKLYSVITKLKALKEPTEATKTTFSTRVESMISAIQVLMDWLRTSESPFGQTIDDQTGSSSKKTSFYLSEIQSAITSIQGITFNDDGSAYAQSPSLSGSIDLDTAILALTNKLEPLKTGQTTLNEMTMKVDDLFYNVSVTIARANRFLSIYVGFVDDYKAMYVSYGDIIVYVVAGLFIAFGLLVLLTVFCTYFCAKDRLLCCAICADQFFFFIIGIAMLALAMASWALMDIYMDLYKSDKVTAFNDLFSKILSLTYWSEETEDIDEAVSTDKDSARARSMFVSLLTNVEEGTYVAPKIQDLLPFEKINAGQLGYWFLKSGDKARDTLLEDFLTPMNSSLADIITQTNTTSIMYGDTAFKGTTTANLSSLATDASQILADFTSNITGRTVERKAIRDMLYTVLDPVFISVAHSLSVMWAGSVIILAFSIPAELILMCGRTLWQPIDRKKSDRYIKQTKSDTVRNPPREDRPSRSRSEEKKESVAEPPRRSSSRSGSSHHHHHHSHRSRSRH